LRRIRLGRHGELCPARYADAVDFRDSRLPTQLKTVLKIIAVDSLYTTRMCIVYISLHI